MVPYRADEEYTTENLTFHFGHVFVWNHELPTLHFSPSLARPLSLNLTGPFG